MRLSNINLIIIKDYDEMSQKAAQIVADIIRTKESPILGLATGSTPVGMYKELVHMYKKGELDFNKTTTFNLDEYYPIHKENKQSYHYFMKENLFNHVNINLSNTYIPNGMSQNSELECLQYDEKIRGIGGVDLQVLGIGSNGHIGFNEPGEFFEPKTQKVNLDQRTIEDNARFFTSIEEVPQQALSMGIGTIMSAKKILLLASGENKAWAIKEMVKGKVTPRIPGSILQFHRDLVVVIDQEAASQL